MKLSRSIGSVLGALQPSRDSRQRPQPAGRALTASRRASGCSARPVVRPARREQGVALVVALTAVTILAVMLADMHENTSTAYAVATTQRDRLQAEYMAKSGLSLTRMLVANEPQIRQTVAPMYQALIGRPPPQLPVWKFADEILKPFCNYEEATKSLGGSGAVELSSVEGLRGAPGTCEITALAENSKININDPLLTDGNQARRSIAMQLFALMGGYQKESPYDPLFEKEDPDGLMTTRLDVVTALVDWWDPDTTRHVFDPGAGEIQPQGAEDDVYSRFDDPYDIKNAPFDSLEELRLVRGISDDFWATFVEPEPGNPEERSLTIYGSGSVNPNEAPPEVLLARLCSFLDQQPLCSNPAESAKFIQIMNTVRSLIPLPFFTRSSDFINFVEGKGGAQDLYPMLRSFLGQNNPMLFTPVNVPNNIQVEVEQSFVTAARILNIQVTGRAGRARVRLDTIYNNHQKWTPPPPNAGSMPPLGVLHYYRME
jgi:general secretion pathway protein K